MKSKLILASGSFSRAQMLQNAGYNFEIMPANIDEDAITEDLIKQKIGTSGIALELSQRKALDVAKNKPDALIIGSDQVLEFEGGLINKAKTGDEAREKLKALRGKTHKLISAVSVVKGDDVLWQTMDEATLTMHDFEDDFLETYCARAGDALTRSVGGYELESYGSWLFSAVHGNFFTILGMPLLPLLKYLREEHGIKP